MLSIVWWTESLEISFPRAKSDQRLSRKRRGEESKRSGRGGEERKKSHRRRWWSRRICRRKFHLLVRGLSRALMAENKEKSQNNRFLHHSQPSLLWKKRWNDRGHPTCSVSLLFFHFSCSPAPLLYNGMMLVWCLDQELYDYTVSLNIR